MVRRRRYKLFQQDRESVIFRDEGNNDDYFDTRPQKSHIKESIRAGPQRKRHQFHSIMVGKGVMNSRTDSAVWPCSDHDPLDS
eukprot:scaffold457_cov117-Skeletonema_dohrnii-CCMP3373.AAC.5